MSRRILLAGLLALAMPCAAQDVKAPGGAGSAAAAAAQETTWCEGGAEVTSVIHQALTMDAMDSSRVLLAGCTSSTTELCLLSGRFLLRGTFLLQDGQGSGPLRFVKLTEASGYLYFSDASDVQAVVKVLDVCGFAGAFWVFIGPLTDQEVHLEVVDTFTGSVKRYDNPLKNNFLPIYDFFAFTTCGATPCTYGLSAPSTSVPAAGGRFSVNLTTSSSGCAWNAASNASFVDIVASSAQGIGAKTVEFDVDPNTGGARSGTLTIAGLTFTVNQAGTTSNQYDGLWSGTSTQGKAFSFTVVNNAFTSFTFAYEFTGSCSGSGSTQITYTTPRAITGSSFTISSQGTPGAPSSTAYTINGTFTSSTQVVGSFNVTVTQSFPNPTCSGSGSGSWSADKQ